MNEIKRSLWSAVVKVVWDVFPCSFSIWETTYRILQALQLRDSKRKIIAIDGSQFTPNIQVINASEIQNMDDITLLNPWTDGIIITGLNGTPISEVKTKVSLILWVADCANIAFSTQDGNTIGLFHAWYKWVANGIITNIMRELWNLWITFEDLPILNETWKVLWTKPSASFYMWPMAGRDFELPVEYFDSLFANFFIQYPKLKKEKYYKPNGNPWKWNLDLRTLIRDVFKLEWVFKRYTNHSPVDTTNPNNKWPSFRLYTHAQSILKKIGTYYKDNGFEMIWESHPSYKNLRQVLKFTRAEARLYLWKHCSSNTAQDRRLAMIVNN